MGSAKRRPTVVSRAYRPSADNCARALELLLTIKKAAEPRKPDGRHDAKGSKHDSRQGEYTGKIART
jgi:hypothetical protein